MDKKVDPQQACEQVLKACRASRVEQNILRSEVLVIDRMLSRSLDLRDAYAELHGKLAGRPPALDVFFDALLAVAAFWNPKKMKEARADRDALRLLNRQIAARADELSVLLDRRDSLHNRGTFTSDTYFHIGDVIEAAAHGNGWFDSHLRGPLNALQGQYDFKYWPQLSKIIAHIGTDAAKAEPAASDRLTHAATLSRTSSPAAFLRVLQEAIAENAVDRGGFLPSSLKLTDETIAALMRCCIELDSGLDPDGPYVKRARQRTKERAVT